MTAPAVTALKPGRYLPPSTPAYVSRLIERAAADFAIVELPPGSNRSPEIDAYNRALGIPLGSPWCASGLHAWCRDSGAAAPPLHSPWYRQHGMDPNRYGPGSVDGWLGWAFQTGRWVTTPAHAHAVVYGKPVAGGRGFAAFDGTHIELVVRLERGVRLAWGANTSIDGGYSREGIGCDLKRIDTESALARILGYIDLDPARQGAGRSA